MTAANERAQIKRIQGELRQLGSLAASTIAVEVSRELEARLPKDSGRLRANNIPSLGPGAGRHYGIAEGARRTATGRAAVAVAGATENLATRHIVNALPYADSVGAPFVPAAITAALSTAERKLSGRRR